MRTRYGASPWIHTLPDSRRPDFPRARGEQTADVVIVGGGLTGCATAYACAVAGLRPVLVEAFRIGQGSSGRGAGLLLADPGPSFRDVAGAYGLRAARQVFESWRRASLDAAALLRRLGIRCGLDGRDTLLVAFRDEERTLRREYDARHDAGIDATWLTARKARELSALEAEAGMRIPDGFAFDPYRACLGLAAAAARRGGLLHERTPVTSVRPGRKHVEIVAEGAVVRASTVIVATGAATAEFSPLRRHFKRRETYLVLTEPVPAAMRRQMAKPAFAIADLRAPRHRLRWTPDDRLLIGGADQDETPARRRDGVLVQRTGQLMYELLTMSPVISGLRPEYGWEMGYGETADGLMYIGPHRNYPRHLFALGGTRDSLTGAFLAARMLVRAVQGTPDKADALFGWTR